MTKIQKALRALLMCATLIACAAPAYAEGGVIDQPPADTPPAPTGIIDQPPLADEGDTGIIEVLSDFVSDILDSLS